MGAIPAFSGDGMMLKHHKRLYEGLPGQPGGPFSVKTFAGHWRRTWRMPCARLQAAVPAAPLSLAAGGGR